MLTFSGKSAKKSYGSKWIWLPCHFFGSRSAQLLGGDRWCGGALTRPSTRHLLPKKIEKTAVKKRGGIFTVQMRGGHNYGNDCILNWRFYHKKGGLRLIGCLLALDKRWEWASWWTVQWFDKSTKISKSSQDHLGLSASGSKMWRVHEQAALSNWKELAS